MFLRYRYPKLIALFLVSLFAYALFSQDSVQTALAPLISESLFSYFVIGSLFTFGFITPFAIGLFLIADPSSPLLAALVGGCGAVLGDMLIFQFIRFSFLDEFGKLKREKIVRLVEKPVTLVPARFHHYLLYAFAGIIIASPLPDELGLSLLAGLTSIRQIPLACISYVCNTVGIFILLVL